MNIVITDPCYLNAHPFDKSNTIYGDWSCMVYKGTLETSTKPEEWNEIYFDFFKKYNSNKTDDEKKNLLNEFSKIKENWKKDNTFLGEFCADAGEVGIFDYDKLNNSDKEWIEKHPWCATVIKDFDGKVSIELIDNSIHVIGKGNFNFFSVQSGL